MYATIGSRRLQPRQLEVQLADRVEPCRRQAPEYFHIGDCDCDDRWEVAGSSACRGDAAAKQRTLAAQVWECQQAEARLVAARSARTETAAVTIQAGVRGFLCRRQSSHRLQGEYARVCAVW